MADLEVIASEVVRLMKVAIGPVQERIRDLELKNASRDLELPPDTIADSLTGLLTRELGTPEAQS